jgi:hypothetical protein
MKIFVYKPVEVLAAQYGVDIEFEELIQELKLRDIRAYMGGKLDEEEVPRVNFFISGSKTVKTIKYGDWIVFSSSLKIELLSESEFNQRFALKSNSHCMNRS